LVTTTPKASALLERLVAEAGAAGTLCGGRMADNLNLPAAFVAGMEAAYRGTRKGREELDGELVVEAEGALWPRRLLERCRVGPVIARSEATRQPSGPESETGLLRSARNDGLRRIVIGVDPPASAEGDACGIVACGVDADGIGWVLGDHSVGGLSPEGWASAVVAAVEVWGADCAIVERNQGGDMVKAVLRAADAGLPVRTVFARFGKGDRAEPVAMLFETGRVRLAGSFPALEDELCAMIRGGGYARPGRSPDRADAMVWALSELLLGKERVAPAVRRF
jgi:phage terminase large subunit-like protein